VAYPPPVIHPMPSQSSQFGVGFSPILIRDHPQYSIQGFAFQLPDYSILVPTPRHSSDAIAVIPIWRGFQPLLRSVSSVLISGKTCLPDVGDHKGVPLPPGSTQFHPSSPNITQGFRWVNRAFCLLSGVPGKPGFGLLGWNVTQGRRGFRIANYHLPIAAFASS
jgi:hypothetical protein